MYRFITILVFILFGFYAAHAAPAFENNQASFKDWLGGSEKSSFNFLDPSRLSVNHSISLGFSGGGGSSLMQSLYTTRLGYKLSDPLTLTFLFGIQNSRFSSKTFNPGINNSFLGGVALDYKPSRNIFIHIEMLQAPGLNWLNRQTLPYQSAPITPVTE